MSQIGYKVNAVVVTYNRLELLKKTINKLREQSFGLNRIIIVNNASTDGTEKYLEEINDEYIDVYNLEKNLGGAGGFHYGIKKAYECECDFVWIMDDDTICSNTALEELVKAYDLISENQNRKIGFLSSDVRFTDEQPCLMNIPATAYIYNEFLEDGIVQVTHTSFVAMLIPSYVIKEVGLPYKEFFIWGDDGEYSTRILQKYLGYLVGKSVVYHYMKENKGVNIFDTPEDRIGRFYYFYRNWTFTKKSRWKKEGRKEVLRNIRLVLKIAKSNTSFKRKKIITIIKGTIDGWNFKANIDYVD